ncbi:MAG: hypothetical protein GXN93_03290 [Candidatus Diapherotrites archaeon]|nr:hypothetical protein [Candidatus Diapherotrites archaeon]
MRKTVHIYASHIHRRVVHEGPKLIVVRESFTRRNGDRAVWFWGFTHDKRGVVRTTTDTHEAVRALEKALLGKR